MTNDRSPSGLTYSEAGVDIDKANQAKVRIRSLARSTFNERVVSDIGSFGGLYRPEISRYKTPILVSSADGVGTKLKIAFMTGIHDTVGIDIVSHCTNDILVHGAIPIFFLDYIATGVMQPETIADIVKGLAEGCKESECPLIGGETAEMPDFYQAGEYDLAGFIVGICDEEGLYQPGQVKTGDVLLGLPSSGLHTNGYSLVRKLFFEQEKLSVEDYIQEFQRTVGEELLTPHRNYLPAVKNLVVEKRISAVAHITGGGITGNLNRVLSGSQNARIRLGSWNTLPIFEFIQARGRVEQPEMYRTFNMGIGMILAVPMEYIDLVSVYLDSNQERYFDIGEIVDGSGEVTYV